MDCRFFMPLEMLEGMVPDLYCHSKTYMTVPEHAIPAVGAEIISTPGGNLTHDWLTREHVAVQTEILQRFQIPKGRRDSICRQRRGTQRSNPSGKKVFRGRDTLIHLQRAGTVWGGISDKKKCNTDEIPDTS